MADNPTKGSQLKTKEAVFRSYQRTRDYANNPLFEFMCSAAAVSWCCSIQMIQGPTVHFIPRLKLRISKISTPASILIPNVQFHARILSCHCLNLTNHFIWVAQIQTQLSRQIFEEDIMKLKAMLIQINRHNRQVFYNMCWNLTQYAGVENVNLLEEVSQQWIWKLIGGNCYQSAGKCLSTPGQKFSLHQQLPCGILI